MHTQSEPERPDDLSARGKQAASGDDYSDDAHAVYRPKVYRPGRHDDDSSSDERTMTPAWTWQVVDGEGVEIDGEATWIDPPVKSDAPTKKEAHTEKRTSAQERVIAEHYDDIVVASVQTRQVEVVAGETAKLVFSLLNNGQYRAVFEVNVEGWIDERWLEDLPLRITLEPGERAQTAVLLAPPRLPSSRAGAHSLALIVRASQYPERYTRAAATLFIQPYTEFRLGYPQPSNLVTSWLDRTCTFSAPVTNAGNTSVRLRLFGTSPRRECNFSFFAADWDSSELGQTVIEVEPGQTAYVAVQVTPLSRPLIGLGPRLLPFRLVAVDLDSNGQRQFVEADLKSRPLIGPWYLAGLMGTLLIAVVGVVLIVFALLVTLRSSNQERMMVPVAQEQPAPVVALVLQAEQPLPTRPADLAATGAGPIYPLPATESQAGAQPFPRTGAGEELSTDGATDTVPVVSADQVTAPGEPTPIPVLPVIAVSPQAAAPASAQGATDGQMTYGDMFRDVGLQYDFDWKILAAQAYIESGFDSLALGQHGDLGLMQIQPNTWREWADQLDLSDPFDSYSNVVVAAVYLDYLRTLLTEEGYGELEWTLVAYNWGPDKLLDYLRAGGSWDSLDSDLKNYALDIMRIANSIPSP